MARQVAERGRFILPEEVRAIRLRERAKFRTVVPFYDYTFSAPKSVSVLWASLLAASAEAEAEQREADAERFAEQAAQVRGAVKRANDRMIAVAGRELAYVRTGHHSKTTGEWRDAKGFIVASFEQHDSRDGNMQLHVHNAIANRAQRADEADETWRALHGQPLFKNKLRMGMLADRFLAQELALLGWLSVLREDGKALEVGGISDAAADEFSTRSKELRDRARELAAEYERDHGHAPGKRAMWAIRQRAALETRDSKDHNPPAAGDQLAAWARKALRSGIGRLAALYEAAAAYSAEHEPSGPPSEAERARIIRKAVAAVQRANATWDRSLLIGELGQVLRALPADVDPEEYLNGLAEEALSGRAEGVNVLQVAPAPDLIDISRLPFRKDGTSIYRPPGEERFCTSEHRDNEQFLVDVAIAARAPADQRRGRGRGPGGHGPGLFPAGSVHGPAGFYPADQLPGGPGRDRQDPRHGRVRPGLGRPAGRARHRPDGQHQRGADHGRRGAAGRGADGDLQPGSVPRQDQGLGRDPRACAGVPR